MHLSKMEWFALIVAFFVGLHFYNQHKLESENFETQEGLSPFYMEGGEPPVILAFGDSLTAGAGVAKEMSYPAWLSQMLGIPVINGGLSKESSTAALKRLPMLLAQKKPDIVLLEIGYDDILAGRSRAQIKRNLKKMVELIQDAGAKAYIIGVPDMDLLDLMISSDIGLYEEVAQETGTRYLSGILGPVLKDVSLRSRENFPNARGYRKIAENIYHQIGE